MVKRTDRVASQGHLLYETIDVGIMLCASLLFESDLFSLSMEAPSDL
jgi:hypothetical protein